jgi:hypothetical protein
MPDISHRMVERSVLWEGNRKKRDCSHNENCVSVRCPVAAGAAARLCGEAIALELRLLPAQRQTSKGIAPLRGSCCKVSEFDSCDTTTYPLIKGGSATELNTPFHRNSTAKSTPSIAIKYILRYLHYRDVNIKTMPTPCYDPQMLNFLSM